MDRKTSGWIYHFVRRFPGEEYSLLCLSGQRAGAFDEKLLRIHSKDVVYLGSLFDSMNEQVTEDRRVIWRMERILRMHRSKEWKKEMVYKMLKDFADEDFDRKLY